MGHRPDPVFLPSVCEFWCDTNIKLDSLYLLLTRQQSMFLRQREGFKIDDRTAALLLSTSACDQRTLLAQALLGIGFRESTGDRIDDLHQSSQTVPCAPRFGHGDPKKSCIRFSATVVVCCVSPRATKEGSEIDITPSDRGSGAFQKRRLDREGFRKRNQIISC